MKSYGKHIIHINAYGDLIKRIIYKDEEGRRFIRYQGKLREIYIAGGMYYMKPY